MPYLMRVELPDVPGSLGRLASAIGEAGGDIAAIEIVEKDTTSGTAVDDVLMEVDPTLMLDSVVSACTALEGVTVIWVSRYAAGGNLFLDLEAVEDLTENPTEAVDRLIDLLPMTFRADWALRVHRVDGAGKGTQGAPKELPFVEIERHGRLEVDSDDDDGETLYAGARIDGNEIVVMGRRGGPDFLDSELARLAHLVGLAATISQP